MGKKLKMNQLYSNSSDYPWRTVSDQPDPGPRSRVQVEGYYKENSEQEDDPKKTPYSEGDIEKIKGSGFKKGIRTIRRKVKGYYK